MSGSETGSEPGPDHPPSGVGVELDPAVPGLRVELADGICTVTFDDVARHNTLTGAMLNGLRGVLAGASTQPDVRVVVLRGAGERAFASGADIGEQAGDAARVGTSDVRSIPAGSRGLVGDLLACTRPVVASIRGWCLGGGLMVALTADIRIAADDAVFGIPAARLGVAYPSEAVAVLVDVCGKGAASDLMLTGRRIDAAEALRIGLVDRLVPAADLPTATEALAAELAANAPLAVTVAKAQIAHAVATLREDADGLADQVRAVWHSADAAEGMASFLERRPPRFTGT